MPAAKVTDTQLLDRLADVFRRYGYEGASLSRIAEATGLQRASLYHRYPGGKEDMAQAVMGQVDERFGGYVLASLFEQGDPMDRAKQLAKRLSEAYDGGSKSCLLDALSRNDAPDGLRDHVDATFRVWLDGMTRLARDAGATPAQARRRAEDAMVAVQGGLVVARASGDPKPFARALRELPGLLAGG